MRARHEFYSASFGRALSLGPFLWFGGPAGEKITPLWEIGREHTKPNRMLEKADKPAQRIITKNQFTRLETMDNVIERLIGIQREASGWSWVRNSQIAIGV